MDKKNNGTTFFYSFYFAYKMKHNFFKKTWNSILNLYHLCVFSYDAFHALLIKNK